MVKLKTCKSKKGLSAFNDYKYWLSLRNRRVSKLETFVDSKYYSCFIKLQSWIGEKGIPDKKLYIRYMLEKNLTPNFWYNNKDLYESFIRHYDETVTPIAMVNTTLSTLYKLADILECDIGEVLQQLLPSEIAKLVFERRLSPWILLLSTKFKHYLHMLNDPSQYVMITSVIDAREWEKKFKKNPEAVAKIKNVISELDL